MKPAPHFSCRLIRSLRAVLSKEGTWGAQHVATCPDCQEYFAKITKLDLGLRADAVRQLQAAPRDMDLRVLRAIEQTVPLPRRSRPKPPLFFGSLALGAAAAIAAVLVVLPVSQHQGTSVEPNESTDPLVADAEVDAGSRRLSWATLGFTEAPDIRANPLQSEVDSVYADARHAARFLALNFLPSETVGRIAPSVENSRRPGNG